MTNLPTTPTDFFAQLLAGGALYGLVSTWLLDGLMAAWEARASGPISGTKRRWLSIAVALVVPVVGYGGLLALGQATLTPDGVYSAVLVGVAAIAGNKIGYAGRESLAKPQGVPLGEQPAYRAAHDAGGDPAPMRAVPAPQDAPPGEAGAPSLADTLAADMGLDTTPEDTV
jgi:hypothetical protein